MNKKILIINKYFDVIGGIEEAVRNLSGIDLPEFEITVLAFGDLNRLKELQEKFPSVRLILLPITITVLRMPISLRFVSVLVKEIQKADIVHFHSPFPLAEWGYVFLQPFISFKAKVITTWHTDIVNPKLLVKMHHWFLRRLFKKSSAIIVTSPTIIEPSPLLQPYKSKIQLIPLGVKGLKEKKHQSLSEFTYALFVGRLVYYKGINYLLDALVGSQINLVIVGDGPLKNELKSQTEKNSINSQITWKGQVSDEELQNLYAGASILVFPSVEITEALGLVQAEAMSYSLPIINTSLPTGVPWVARNNIEAITVPVKDSQALHSALVTLYENNILRQQLGEKGRQRYEEVFTVEAMRNHYIELYKSL